MFNFAFVVILLLLGLIDVDAMSIKRSEKSTNNLEKVDNTEYPIKVNYDVYPVSLMLSCVFFSGIPRISMKGFLFFIWHKDENFHVMQQVVRKPVFCVGLSSTWDKKYLEFRDGRINQEIRHLKRFRFATAINLTICFGFHTFSMKNFFVKIQGKTTKKNTIHGFSV